MNENKDTYKKVRIHKHNYAGEFGNVVVEPISVLIEELLMHPEIFTLKERQDILECYRQVMKISGQYEVLGYTLMEQLLKVQDKMIPTIKANCSLLENTISKSRNYQDESLVELLRWSIGNTPGLCSKLSKIEEDEKGETKAIYLVDFIEDVFKEEQKIRNLKGLPSYDISIYGREFSNVQIQIDPDGFKNSVLHNIIENTYKHAFNNEHISTSIKAEVSNAASIKVKAATSTKEKATGSLGFIIGGIIGAFGGSLLSNKAKINHINEFKVQNKQVQIIFKKEKDSPNYITLIIENNGKPYSGDPNKVFDYEVGDNTGIGLYSAKDFLTKNGATIEMVSTPNEEFTVHINIKIPIYEQ